MKIVDKIKDKQEEQWQLGDVVESESGNRGIIIRDDTDDCVIMPITGDHAYQTSQSYGDYEIDVLQQNKSLLWHKVNAKLVTE
ncbi:hypothetical protein [Lactobacillus gasseri]|uniref:hypothetical protein n=1 Tax=Lactobacillus gasseri TaxID=1596 RepID=UPI00066907CD|nr:hypothetical protein [Lactobacillus gasseri]